VALRTGSAQAAVNGPGGGPGPEASAAVTHKISLLPPPPQKRSSEFTPWIEAKLDGRAAALQHADAPMLGYPKKREEYVEKLGESGSGPRGGGSGGRRSVRRYKDALHFIRGYPDLLSSFRSLGAVAGQGVVGVVGAVRGRPGSE
jgi:hypothetical protein